MKRLVDLLIRLARRTPYSHLFHADGAPYMERFWLMPRWALVPVHEGEGTYYKPAPWMPFALRMHHLCTPDYDAHLHDHPWNFVSLVLRGGYVEHRPVSVDPSFFHNPDVEDHRRVIRRAGSIALRRATDRHLIAHVLPQTWTLFATGEKQHWWGFYTPGGKVWWRDYPSCHAAHESRRGGRRAGRRMKLPARLLRLVSNGGGPRTKEFLEHMSAHWGYSHDFDPAFRDLVERGQLVMYGDKRGARYGAPGWGPPQRPARRARVRILSQ